MAGGQALPACSNLFHTELQGLLLEVTEDTINMFTWRLSSDRSRKASERAWICRELFGYRQPQAMSEVSWYCAHDQLLQSICRYAPVAAERLPNELGCAGNSSVIGNPKPCRKFHVTVRMISCYNQYRVVTLGSQPKGFRTSLVVPRALRLSATRSHVGIFMHDQYVHLGITLGSQPKSFRTSLVVPETLRLSATPSHVGSFMFPCLETNFL